MTNHCAVVNVLSHEACRIVMAGDLQQLKVLRTDFVLDPQVRDSQVPDLAKASAPANSYRGCGVRKDTQVKVKARICSNGA